MAATKTTRGSELDGAEGWACNVAVVAGVLSSDPVVRQLASGDEVVNYEVTSRDASGVASSVPVALVGPDNGRRPTLVKGDAIVVTGRVNRRFFRGNGGTQSRTEVLADRVVPATRKKAAATAIERALESVWLE